MSGRPKRSAHIYTAEWGLNYNHLAPCLGLGRKTRDGKRYRTSCTSELHTVLAALSAEVFEAALTRWILAQGVTDLDQRLVAIDGKTLRGSQGHQLPGVHLLAASCRDVAAVIAPPAVPSQTNEPKTALQLWRHAAKPEEALNLVMSDAPT